MYIEDLNLKLSLKFSNKSSDQKIEDASSDKKILIRVIDSEFKI